MCMLSISISNLCWYAEFPLIREVFTYHPWFSKPGTLNFNNPSILTAISKFTFNIESLLTETEKETIYNSNSTQDKVHKLISYLPKKGKDAIKKFIQCLRSTQEGTGYAHSHLADILESKDLVKNYVFIIVLYVISLKFCSATIVLIM